MIQKRFIFVRDFISNEGQKIPKGTQIEIVGDNIFMYNGTVGGQIIDPLIYNMLHDFIEKEYQNPTFLKEVVVPINKC